MLCRLDPKHGAVVLNTIPAHSFCAKWLRPKLYNKGKAKTWNWSHQSLWVLLKYNVLGTLIPSNHLNGKPLLNRSCMIEKADSVQRYWHLDPRHLKYVYRFLKHLKGTFRLSITVPGPNDVFKATKWQAPLIDLHDWQCGNLPMKCCIATRKHHNESIDVSSILAASARLPDKKLLSGTIRSDDNVPM
jgi:hypothetical protein